MPIDTLVFWLIIAALVVVADLIAMQCLRAAREGKRIMSRVSAYTEAPVIERISQAPRDLERLERSLDAVPNLLERARTSWAKITLARR